MDRIGVIGAGFAGLACARDLALSGVPVEIYDKGRGPGGRAATRRAGHLRFDHGAPYFTARHPRLLGMIESWHDFDVVARWRGCVRILEDGELRPAERRRRRWVGTPGMSDLLRHIGRNLDVQYGWRVTELHRDGDAWWIDLHTCGPARTADRSEGPFNALALAIPAPRAAELLEPVLPAVAERLRSVRMTPCIAAMAAFPEPLDPGFAAAFVRGSPVGRAWRNCSKPGRGDDETWVLHATDELSETLVDEDPDPVAAELVRAFGEALRRELPEPTFLCGHRWRHAGVAEPLGADCLCLSEYHVGLCGDWCIEGRIEGALRSGWALAARMLQQLGPD